MESQSTPCNSVTNPPRMDLEESAILPVIPQLPSTSSGLRKKPQMRQLDKKAPLMVDVGNRKKKLTMRSSNTTDRSHGEYLAKMPDCLELLYNQYVQTAYLVRTQMQEFPKQQQKMMMLLSALMEENHRTSIELFETTRDIVNLQNKIVLDEQLDLQTDSLKSFDSFCDAVHNMKKLSEVLDSRRHILKLKSIAPQTGDFVGILKQIERTVGELSDLSTAFMQQSTGITAMIKVLEEGASFLEDCNNLSVKVEHLAIDEMGFEIQRLL